jgi:hypothetical protein
MLIGASVGAFFGAVSIYVTNSLEKYSPSGAVQPNMKAISYLVMMGASAVSCLIGGIVTLLLAKRDRQRQKECYSMIADEMQAIADRGGLCLK